MVNDDDEKKLTKKELGYRLFEVTRFRTLEPGDYVAAKVSSQDLWILARVVKEWNSLELSYKHMKDLSEVGAFATQTYLLEQYALLTHPKTKLKRDAMFSEKVHVQGTFLNVLFNAL